MKTKRPAPTPTADARREIKQHLAHWAAMCRWMETLRDLDSQHSDGDTDLAVHCQSFIKYEIVRDVRLAAGAREDEAAIAVMDDVIIVVIPGCEDDKPDDTHITESDGFLLLPRPAMAVLETDDAA